MSPEYTAVILVAPVAVKVYGSEAPLLDTATGRPMAFPFAENCTVPVAGVAATAGVTVAVRLTL